MLSRGSRTCMIVLLALYLAFSDGTTRGQLPEVFLRRIRPVSEPAAAINISFPFLSLRGGTGTKGSDSEEDLKADSRLEEASNEPDDPDAGDLKKEATTAAQESRHSQRGGGATSKPDSNRGPRGDENGLDRQEELRRKLQRFNQKYGVGPISRWIDSSQIEKPSARRNKIDPQTALKQAQRDKEQAQKELRELTQELEQDSQKRPERRLEHGERAQLKRRCNRLRQVLSVRAAACMEESIRCCRKLKMQLQLDVCTRASMTDALLRAREQTIGDVKRLEKNLALKKQFNAEQKQRLSEGKRPFFVRNITQKKHASKYKWQTNGKGSDKRGNSMRRNQQGREDRAKEVEGGASKTSREN